MNCMKCGLACDARGFCSSKCAWGFSRERYGVVDRTRVGGASSDKYGAEVYRMLCEEFGKLTGFDADDPLIKEQARDHLISKLLNDCQRLRIRANVAECDAKESKRQLAVARALNSMW